MKEPRTLLDDHQSGLESLLLTAMRADRPSPRARERALAGVSRWGVPVLLGFWTKSAIASLTPWAKIAMCMVAASTVPVTVGVVRAIQTSNDGSPQAIVTSPRRGAQGAYAPERHNSRDAPRPLSLPSTPTREPAPVPALVTPAPPAENADPSSRAVGSAVGSVRRRLTTHAEGANQERDSIRVAKDPSTTYAAHSEVRQPRDAEPRDAEPRDAEPRLAEPRLAEPMVGVDAEAATLHAVRRSLATGDSSGALAMLDDYHRRFPAAHLATEAAVLRVESLMVAGNRSAAEALGRSLIDASPYGPHARRIRALLGWKEE